MIIVDTALEKREQAGKPIRVGMIGAGFMARGITIQILQSLKGMRLVAIANRKPEKARKAYEEAGVSADAIVSVTSVTQLEQAIASAKPAITEDPLLLCRAENIDVLIEVTGSIEYGSRVVLEAISNGKHVVLMNPELDGTVGPILKVYADKAGVVLSNADGDQPGVIGNLYRFVKGLGVRPVLCGNIKGLHDPYRNPTTQEGFAKKWGQNPYMVTSFADGSKISFEQAIVANATGMRVAKRGMFGPTVPSGTSIMDAVNWYPHAELLNGPGVVDYVVGAVPSPGVFVIGAHDNPIQKHYLNLYKLGEGPLYVFYTPYHLCHFEAPYTAARAVLFQDAALTPLGAPRVDVVTTAKVDLNAGDVIDAIGGYKTYGLAENYSVSRAERLLPIGIAEGCVLKRPVAKDAVVTYDDVTLPANHISIQLRSEQDRYFPG